MSLNAHASCRKQVGKQYEVEEYPDHSEPKNTAKELTVQAMLFRGGRPKASPHLDFSFSTAYISMPQAGHLPGSLLKPPGQACTHMYLKCVVSAAFTLAALLLVLLSEQPAREMTRRAGKASRRRYFFIAIVIRLQITPMRVTETSIYLTG